MGLNARQLHNIEEEVLYFQLGIRMYHRLHSEFRVQLVDHPAVD